MIKQEKKKYQKPTIEVTKLAFNKTICVVQNSGQGYLDIVERGSKRIDVSFRGRGTSTGWDTGEGGWNNVD